jgi:acyl carrier protein
MQQATIEAVKAIIERTGSLTESASLKEDIPLTQQGVDSLDLANIMLLLEEEYDIKIPDEDMPELDTLKHIVDYVNEKLA